MYYTYILKSLKDDTYYYGSTENLELRLKRHNTRKERYTRGHSPYRIHYFEKYETRSEAFRREMFFKSIEGFHWLRSKKII